MSSTLSSAGPAGPPTGLTALITPKSTSVMSVPSPDSRPRLFLRRGHFSMTSRGLALTAWCLVGLLFASGLALALILNRPGSDRDGNDQEQGCGCDDEDEPAGPALFKDVTKTSGVKWSCRNGEEFGHLAILELPGCGVGLIDYDGDGLLDLFVVGGGSFDKYDKDLEARPPRATLQS